MVDHGGGAIVNTGSSASYRGSLAPAWYTAAKHGVAGLTKGAAFEYAQRSIRINAVCPGVTQTEFNVESFGLDGTEEMARRLNPTGRVIDPANIGAAVVWLCSDAASGITGAILPVDAGQSTV
jgi:NAD(P)-dependent dehydrogenase (short-subunit alcohol dehydrogenase family)